MSESPAPVGTLRRIFSAAFGLFLFVSAAVSAQIVVPDQTIYVDSLQNGWQDWSGGWATVNLSNLTPVHSGADSISVSANAWQAMYLEHAAFDSNGYTSLRFWIRGGGAGNQQLALSALRSAAAQTPFDLPPLTTSWQQMTITLTQLGVSQVTDFDGFWIQDRSGTTQPVFYVDDVTLIGGTIAAPPPVSVTVDRGADRRAVSPEIFGVCAGPGDVLGLPWPVVRWGGNSTTRYNWQLDTHNTASDWFYMNIPDGNGALNSVDQLVDAVRSKGGNPLITLSTIGWTPKLRQKNWGFSQALYGAQPWNECVASPDDPAELWCKRDAGDGVLASGAKITNNSPFDTSIAITPAFEAGFMAHIASHILANAAAGGVKYFALDNEPALWSSTHRDVHPLKLGYTEMWNYTTAYGAAAKVQDPNVKIFGPVEWGWCSYFWSDADGCGNSNGADYLANGPLLEWYLRKAKDWEKANGKRLIDYLDIHFYPQNDPNNPQNDGVSLTNLETSAVAALRLRSIKSLYDPNYIDESWIGDKVRMIPRLRDMIAKNYPGTKIAITEYNFGGVASRPASPGDDNGITAALAQSEALAIFAREGVDIATRWVLPVGNTRVEDGFKLFMDYNGAGAQVAGDSVRAVSSDVDTVGAYCIRGAGASNNFYILLFNKSTQSQTVNLTVSGGINGSLALYGYDFNNRLGAAGSAAPGGGGVFAITLPARSARLGVGQLAVCAIPVPVTNLKVRKSGASLQFNWDNQASMLDYTVSETPWLAGDFSAATGTAASGTTGFAVPGPSGDRFYRVAARNGCGTGPGN